MTGSLTIRTFFSLNINLNKENKILCKNNEKTPYYIASLKNYLVFLTLWSSEMDILIAILYLL